MKVATTADILGTAGASRTPAKWREHYERLTNERDRLMQRDLSPPTTFNARMDDPADAAADESQTSLSLVAAGATQDTLAEILDALHRIDRGTYGICEITGEPIEAERLQAIPWARYSLQGQNELEKNGLGRKHGLPPVESIREVVQAEDGD
jgi:RNA polymerase-binding transcription factor DksA